MDHVVYTSRQRTVLQTAATARMAYRLALIVECFSQPPVILGCKASCFSKIRGAGERISMEVANKHLTPGTGEQ